GLRESGEHAGQLSYAFVVVHAADHAGPVAATGIDHQMHVGVGGDLREVSHHDDLMRTGQPRQPPSDLYGGPAADAGVDLVAHHRCAFLPCGEDILEIQTPAGKL